MEKYPRTYHLSFSDEIHSDDKLFDSRDEDSLFNDDVVITLKVDGGNCCIKPDVGVFARSHSIPVIERDFDYIKNVHFYSKQGLLNKDYHYFGENLFAIHSIEYKEIEDYYYSFNILDKKTDTWLSWEDVVKESLRCNFEIVPILFKGKTSKKDAETMIREAMGRKWLGGEPEGFVVRPLKSFKNDKFSNKVAKFVREGHVQTDEHWRKNWKQASLKKQL